MNVVVDSFLIKALIVEREVLQVMHLVAHIDGQAGEDISPSQQDSKAGHELVNSALIQRQQVMIRAWLTQGVK